MKLSSRAAKGSHPNLNSEKSPANSLIYDTAYSGHHSVSVLVT